MEAQLPSPPSQPAAAYKSTGDAAYDTLQFFHVLERLKARCQLALPSRAPYTAQTQKRTGWVRKQARRPLIGDHMHRMAVLALCTADPTLDVAKCVQLAVVHDLAEATVGDIAPSDGVSKAEKNAWEAAAMRTFAHEMLHDSVAARRIYALWEEYEEQATPEARFVKDLDRIEMALQASEYERRHGARLQEFFDSSLPRIAHPEVQRWGDALAEERGAGP